MAAIGVIIMQIGFGKPGAFSIRFSEESGLGADAHLPTEIHSGDALDFWRVIYASRPKKRMLLYAEMKLPGEAWLEFKIDENNVFTQTATFRPKGIWGRFYWIFTSPFHYFIFKGMMRNIIKHKPE